MQKILESATQWKDFLWIVFTLIATLTTMITCIRTKKSLQQPLYNKILEKQMEALTEILEMMQGSWGDFVCGCELKSMVTFNIIGHLEAMGCMEQVEDESLSKIARDFANLREQNNQERDEEEIEKILDEISEITILKGDDFSYVPNKREEKEEQILAGQQVTLLDGRGLYLCTRNLGRIGQTLRNQLGNVYMPGKIQEQLAKFDGQFDEFCMEKIGNICKREEERVIEAEPGTEITIDFARLNNELVEEFQMVQKSYEELRKEIRKFLKIDARW